ncbi:MAG: 16S rRNA (cytosine(967)-C(5))-methyltransferase RsmB [Gammaproteobacteria bacterium]|nr:16S rRNA (cytosine(967)-C(5))-methyltransferase RsmB [Gammaproteobacteria bacterium]MCH9744497.1 16S rRNA (cytosine(967)-C(5))-methyltransferase RsmB [Gammaproteobacteria bacterium]
MNTRTLISQIIFEVATNRRSLDDAFDNFLPAITHQQDVSLVKAVCFGTLRWFLMLEAISHQLLFKPVKDKDVFYLILIGLYQIIFTDIPDYAAISETVGAAKKLKKNWACGLINKVLREYTRQSEKLLESIQAKSEYHYSHPRWMVDKLKQSYPEQWQDILNANNAHPPMFLRVNLNKITREQYCQLLADQKIIAKPVANSKTAILLEQACAVDKLPLFYKGFCSIQDAAGQQVVDYLDLKPGLRVLDACAAPGSKTCHIIETEPNLQKIVAIDKSAARLQRVQQNIDRLQLNPPHLQLNPVSVEAIDRWWDNKPFDRILLDAPCSAMGVIRRHPDIKLLRRPEDIEQSVKQQLKLLNALIPLVAKGGILVYTTCSILPEENQHLIEQFIVECSRKITLETSKQLLPGFSDGFYFAKLRC